MYRKDEIDRRHMNVFHQLGGWFLIPDEQGELKLDELKEKDQSYYNGVTNGWSILVTGQKKHNMIILPGKRSRTELSSALPNEFWEENKKLKFKYLDGHLMKNNR